MIDRAMDAMTDHAQYQKYSFKNVLRLYSVCLHLHCIQTFGVKQACVLGSDWVFQMNWDHQAFINGILQESIIF